jgi:hypothetical protein
LTGQEIAFFAVDRPSNEQDSENVAVYALNLRSFDKADFGLVTVPSSVSGYIHAQQGVFTFDKSAETFYLLNQKYPSILDSLENTNAQIVKITLPKLQARIASERLLLYRISTAHLMPALDNVTITLQKIIGLL